MELGNSMEDYLKTILMLQRKDGAVHSVDIARSMNFSKASVCRAVKELKKIGCLKVLSDGTLMLTQEGINLAEEVYERYVLFKEILLKVGVDEETAVQDACRLEHAISRKSYEKIRCTYKSLV